MNLPVTLKMRHESVCHLPGKDVVEDFCHYLDWPPQRHEHTAYQLALKTKSVKTLLQLLVCNATQLRMIRKAAHTLLTGVLMPGLLNKTAKSISFSQE